MDLIVTKLEIFRTFPYYGTEVKLGINPRKYINLNALIFTTGEGQRPHDVNGEFYFEHLDYNEDVLVEADNIYYDRYADNPDFKYFCSKKPNWEMTTSAGYRFIRPDDL